MMTMLMMKMTPFYLRLTKFKLLPHLNLGGVCLIRQSPQGLLAAGYFCYLASFDGY